MSVCAIDKSGVVNCGKGRFWAQQVPQFPVHVVCAMWHIGEGLCGLAWRVPSRLSHTNPQKDGTTQRGKEDRSCNVSVGDGGGGRLNGRKWDGYAGNGCASPYRGVGLYRIVGGPGTSDLGRTHGSCTFVRPRLFLRSREKK